MKGKLQKATPPPHPHTRRVWKGIPSVTNASLSLWSGIWRTIKGRKFTFYRTHSCIAQNVYNMHLLSLYLANNKNIFRRAAGRKKECRGPSEGSLTPKLTPLTPTPRGLLGPANPFHSASSPENGSHFPSLPGNNCDSVQGGWIQASEEETVPSRQSPTGLTQDLPQAGGSRGHLTWKEQTWASSQGHPTGRRSHGYTETGGV